MIKRLLLVLVLVSVPFILGLLFTFDIIKIDWLSTMKIQPSYQPQSDPLNMPAQSVPITGAAYIPGQGAPVNPVPADKVSLDRGKILYNNTCALCHGVKGDGKGPFSAFLPKYKPANLLTGNPVNLSDGAIFMVISNGIEGRMPNLRENLPELRMRWDVVNYVRSLQKQANP
jgi:mono/diheme cytochrome c family protein